eukprot:3791196-Rhodomonas_salina.1
MQITLPSWYKLYQDSGRLHLIAGGATCALRNRLLRAREANGLGEEVQNALHVRRVPEDHVPCSTQTRMRIRHVSDRKKN